MGWGYKGPKAILSSAIAGALADYFVVDQDKIQSNLLSDTKIVLKHVKLKDQVQKIPVNSAGKTTVITITGNVEEVEFKWSWVVTGSEDSWVKDAKLTISGAKFRASLTHEDRTEDEPTQSETEDVDKRAKYVNPDTIDKKAKTQIQQGGLAAYVQRQVNMVIDMLTLRMVDFELRIDLPQPLKLTESKAVISEIEGSRSLIVAVKGIELLSFGRKGSSANDATAVHKLKQRLHLSSFSMSVLVEGLDESLNKTYPMIDPFSYSAEMSRVGERFGGFLTGTKLYGMVAQEGSSLDLFDQGGLSFHVGHVQFDTMMQIGAMLLTPASEEVKPTEGVSNDANAEDQVLSSAKSIASGTSEIIEGTPQFDLNEPSSFVLPLAYASLVLYDEKKIKISDIDLNYRADGTVCSFQASKITYDGKDHGQAEVEDVLVTARPYPKMTIQSINSLYLSDSFQLASPIKSSEWRYEGSTLSMKLESFDMIMFSKEEETPPPEPPPIVYAPYLPCNIDLHIEKDFKIRSASDGSSKLFTGFDLYVLVDAVANKTKVALQFDTFRNHLASMSKVSVAGTIPHDIVNVVEDFMFCSCEAAKIKSGHSTFEWEDEFRPRERPSHGAKKVKEGAKAVASSSSHHAMVVKEKKSSSSSNTVALPMANVAEMKLTITVDATVVGVKDAHLTIKPYRGNANTTMHDLTNYYVRACISRVPHFISNAEILGLNIVDSASGLLANGFAIPVLGSAFGAGAGALAITAVDAVKGAVDAGKRSRKVDEDSQWHPGDFTRGLWQAAIEATREGAQARGKEGGGNIIDWSYGAAINNTKYVKENKTRLGAAGGGGVGFITGMAIGGPIGAIIGGVIGTATTGATIEAVDKHVQKNDGL